VTISNAATKFSGTSLLLGDLEMFAKLGIPAGLLERAGVLRVSDYEARQEFGIRGSGDMAGIAFPYFDPQTMHNGRHRCYVRIRRDHPDVEDGKQHKKYVCPYGDRKHLYFPPTPELFVDVAVPIVLVEAEKSALALTAWAARVGRKVLPISLGGVWGWIAKIGIKETATGERVPEHGPVPDLNICRDGRKTFILLDNNSRTNPSVQAARRKLSRQLVKQGAEVYILDLPTGKGINGPDDLVSVRGDDAMAQVFTSRPAPETDFITDDDLALRFSDAYAEDLRYVPKWGKWLRYVPPCWEEDDILKVWDRSREICRAAANESDPKDAGRLRAKTTIAAVEQLARCDSRHATTVDVWDTNTWLFNTPAGTVDLRTANTRDHAASDYITKTSTVGPSGSCSLWLEFLDRVTASDTGLTSYLQRVAGYCLTGSTVEHALFFLYGTGANGKSTFTKTLLGIWGDYGRTAPSETFMESKQERHPCDLAMLRGARLVVASEVESNARWAESRIKDLTGGDQISARFMRQDYFEYTPQFKLLICGNHKPSLRSIDEAIRRRMNLVPFTVTIPEGERDQKLGERLKAEYRGILNWAIEGCFSWQQQGLNPPDVVRNATEQYLSAEDIIAQWLDECCLVSSQAGSSRASVLYGSYKSWAEAGNEHVLSQRRFGQKLQDKGFNKRESHGFVYDGIALREGQE
jgi:putative DNA primase/helicase